MGKNEEVDKRLLSKSWRLNNLYKITNKQGQLITFCENDVQKDFNAAAHTRNLILKSRQHGFTTDIDIDGFDDVLFKRNFVFTIIADTKEHSLQIFDKIQRAWINFPLKHLYTANTDRTNELSFNHGSVVRVTTSARSGTVNRLHISEFGHICAAYPTKAKEILTGSIPAVPKNGRIDIESTAEGEIGYFHDMFMDAWGRTPQNELDFKAFFYGWLRDPDCQLDGLIDQVPKELRDYQKLHKITDKQIIWYFSTWKTLRDKMKQEFPTTPEEAFESSGERLFDAKIIDQKLVNDVVTPNIAGNWKTVEDYRPNHNYGQGNDVSEGIGQDSCTAAIIDFTAVPARLVSIYANNKIDPRLFAFEVRNGGIRYGNCITGVERNNHGHATLGKLIEIYPRQCIYKEVKTEKGYEQKTEKLGWESNLASKPMMLYDLKEAVEEGLLVIPFREALIEMRAFSLQNLNVLSYDEESTQHFDLLTAIAIAWQMRKHIVKFNPKPTASYPQNEYIPLHKDVGL